MYHYDISIIIPVYNVSSYLHELIDSIINQDFDMSKVEIIFIDDRSTDNSVSIINGYIKQFKNMKLICNEHNKKPGYCRNIGIDASLGKFITFIDADDIIKPNHLSSMFYYSNVSRVVINQFTNNLQSPVAPRKIISNIKTSLLTRSIGFHVFGILFHRSIFSNIRFREDVLLEDIDFMIKCLYHLSYIKITSNKTYIYRIREDSASHLVNDELINYLKLSIAEVDEFIKNESDNYKSVWARSKVEMMASLTK